MRRAVVAAMPAVLALAMPAAATARAVTVTDGFTATGVAGAQAVIHLAHPTPAPGPLGSGPPIDLAVSRGALAGFALVAVRGGAYAAVAETTTGYTCGRADCGDDAYRRDADAYGTKSGRLPAGDYRLVLVGEKGARVTVTWRPSSRRLQPTRVRVTPSRYTVDVRATGSVTGAVAGVQPTDRGSYHHDQASHLALVGVVHTIALTYGSSIDYTLCAGKTATSGECGGIQKVGSQDFSDDASALPVFTTPVYVTHVLLVPSDAVEADVGGSWQATVYAAQSSQRGLGVYVPLETG